MDKHDTEIEVVYSFHVSKATWDEQKGELEENLSQNSDGQCARSDAKNHAGMSGMVLYMCLRYQLTFNIAFSVFF